jgi:SAM-dependent methyltransferase
MSVRSLNDPSLFGSVPPPSLRAPGVPLAPLHRRVTPQKALRRLFDAWHDLVSARSLRFAVRLLKTNWHSGHDALADLFRTITPGKDEAIVDIGCGLGRVVAFLSSRYPENRVIGIEADTTALFPKEIFAGNPHIEIRHGNFEALFPAEATVFYIYPPTEGDFLRRLKGLIDRSATRDTTVVAKGALGSLGYFRADPTWSVEPVPPPTSWLRRFTSTHFIYRHEKRGPGYHYGVILRKKVAGALPR